MRITYFYSASQNNSVVKGVVHVCQVHLALPQILRVYAQTSFDRAETLIYFQANVRVLERSELQESLDCTLERPGQREILEVNLYRYLVDPELLDEFMVEFCIRITLDSYICA